MGWLVLEIWDVVGSRGRRPSGDVLPGLFLICLWLPGLTTSTCPPR